ncbi:hypothetical protein DV737_g5602, partial [Chaetothyriales sp. CBS 132003]
MRKARAQHVHCECPQKGHSREDCPNDKNGKHEPGTCCCQHTSKCTCAAKKDHLQAVPEEEAAQATEPSQPAKRLSNHNCHDSKPTVFTNGHHKPVHKFNDSHNQFGSPYRIPARSHGQQEAAQRSSDSLPLTNITTRPQLESPLHSIMNADATRQVRSEHNSPMLTPTLLAPSNFDIPPFVPALDYSSAFTNNRPDHLGRSGLGQLDEIPRDWFMSYEEAQQYQPPKWANDGFSDSPDSSNAAIIRTGQFGGLSQQASPMAAYDPFTQFAFLHNASNASSGEVSEVEDFSPANPRPSVPRSFSQEASNNDLSSNGGDEMSADQYRHSSASSYYGSPHAALLANGMAYRDGLPRPPAPRQPDAGSAVASAAANHLHPFTVHEAQEYAHMNDGPSVQQVTRPAMPTASMADDPAWSMAPDLSDPMLSLDGDAQEDEDWVRLLPLLPLLPSVAMGSEPQFAKYPNLHVAQSIFTLTVSRQPTQAKSSLEYLQHAIKQGKMAPLYRHLAHPIEGVLNSNAEAVIEPALTRSNTLESTASRTRRGSLIASNLIPNKKTLPRGLLPWDEALYDELKADNDRELEEIQKEEDEAAEKAGETEVLAARGKRADFWARVGDKDRAISAFETVFEKTGPLGAKIDIVLAIVRVGLFFNDKAFVKKQVERASILVESGGDWDRRNRLKAYKGLHLLTVRSYSLAAPLLLDSLSTFTSYELCSYSSLVAYAVLAGSLSLKRVDFKSKVVDAPEIKAILGDGEEKEDAEMKDVAGTDTPERASGLVNLSTLGTATSATDGHADEAVDFSPLAGLVKNLYAGNYHKFFVALAGVEENFLTQDRYLYEHRAWFVREMRLRGYQQLLQSYRVVGLKTMAHAFGVSVDFLDRDLAKFIAGGRVSCTIDRVQGVIETTRPDDKNKQYADLVKQGDALITKLQKYGQAVRLRGSERA